MEMNNQPTGSNAPAPKQIKLSQASLPPGTKEGDKLTLTVTGLDQATGTVYCTADAPQAEGDGMSDAPAEPQDGDEPEGEGPDTKTLLGPMDGLKNYLVQKSMDVPKNQGR